MRLINDERDDLSLEAMVVIASIMSMVYGAEIAAYRLADAFDAFGAKGTLVQTKKRALNAARRNCAAMITNLETAFDQPFNQLVMKEGAEYAGTRDAEFHALGAEILELVIVFMSKSEGMDHEKRRNIFKMLNNFKQVSAVDLPALVKFFRFDG